MNKVELLAPAGTKEAFIGAINAGANAVFLAGKHFGARAYAENFTNEDIKQLVTYAHIRGVKVFVVVNTLIFDDEVFTLLAYTDELVSYGIDALIVQDIGLIKLFVNRYKNLDIHASTQVNAHNLTQVRYLKSLGVKRVILARETPLDVIKTIKEQIDIELEVFIHGALCMSYSGNCLISSVLNKRSGNRGACSYNCRLPYQLYKGKEKISEEAFLMSAKDLMTFDYVDELLKLGIESLKIEGRMRKEMYVIQTVLSYRKKIDAYYQKTSINHDIEIDKLKRVFNRDYTKGYMFEEIPKDINNDFRPNHIGIKIGEVLGYEKNLAKIYIEESLKNGDGFRVVSKKDVGNDVTYMENAKREIIKVAQPNSIIYLEVKSMVYKGDHLYKTTDIELERSLQIYLNENYKLNGLEAHLEVYKHKPIKMKLKDDLGNHYQFISDFVLDESINHPIRIEDLKTQLFKLGDTPYYYKNLLIDTDHQSFVPLKALNQFRRQMVTGLNQKRLERNMTTIEIYSPSQPELSFNEDVTLSVKVTTQKQVEAAMKLGIKRIFYDETIAMNLNHSALMPAKKRILTDKAYHIDGPCLIDEIGYLIKNEKGFDLYASEFLNVTNIYTANLLHQSHVKTIQLSSELNKEKLLNFSDLYFKTFNHRPNLEMVIYGRKDLMISKYCVVAKTFDYKPNCKLCFKDQYYLKDEKEGFFPLINDGECNMRLIDSKPINLISEIPLFKKAHINNFRLDFTVETYEETLNIIQVFKERLQGRVLKLSEQNYRNGNYR